MKLYILSLSMLSTGVLYPMLGVSGLRMSPARLPIASARLAVLYAQPKRHLFDAIKPIIIVQQKQCAILERFGKYKRTLKAGIHFKWPFIETLRQFSWGIQESRIDLREIVRELPKQHVITGDNVEMNIGGLVYWKIDESNPEKSVYEISALPYAIEKLAQTTLRNIVGSMHFDETLTSRDRINKTLCSTLDGATDKWSVRIERVELQEITPPKEILLAMEKQMTAERVRRAVVTDAEGKREAAIKQAEGDRESTIKRAEAQKFESILKAEGDSEAIIKRAEAEKISAILRAEGDALARVKRGQAEADAIEAMKKVTGDSATDYIRSIEYIHTLPIMMAGQNNKLIVVPHELNQLASLLNVGKELIKAEK